MAYFCIFLKNKTMIKLSLSQWIFTTTVTLCFAFNTSACVVDVVIVQGNSITMCPGVEGGLTATSGYTQYTWSGPVTGNGQSATANGSGWIYVEATDNIGCISKDSILVTLYPAPNPVISSSEGLNICPAINGTTLSLGNTYNSYTWNDGSVAPTLFITETREYKVTVTDGNGCTDSTSISINFIEFELNSIGGSTVCTGSYLALEATGGDVYAWSTGEFSPTIVVAPTEETIYSVTIYKGACYETLSTTISVANLPPHSIPDTIYVLPGSTEYVYGPANFDTYLWSPVENVTSTSASYTGYTGTSSGNVTLVAMNNAVGCAMTHTVHFKLIELTIPEGFSPNGDGINDVFEIPEIFEFEAKLKVWNRWGDIVFESDRYRNEWNGTCQSSFCLGQGDLPEGTYYYRLTIEGHNFDSFLTLKK
jgi:gliding motility-associated-like protein